MKAIPMHQFLLAKNIPSVKGTNGTNGTNRTDGNSQLPQLDIEGISDDGKELQLFAQLLAKDSLALNPDLDLPGEMEGDLQQSDADLLSFAPIENKLISKGTENKAVVQTTGKLLSLKNDRSFPETMELDPSLKDLLNANSTKKPLTEFVSSSDNLRPIDLASQVGDSDIEFLVTKGSLLPRVNKMEMADQKELIGLDGEKIIELNQKRQQLLAKSNELKGYLPTTSHPRSLKPMMVESSGKDTSYHQTALLTPVFRPKDENKEKNFDYLIAADKGAKVNYPTGNTIEIKLTDKLIDQSNPNKLIEKISQIIENHATFQQSSLKINVHHEQLGSFQVQVRPNGNNQGINIEIITNTPKGQEFFQQQEGALLRNLQEAGVRTFDLKLTNSMEVRSEVFAKNFLPTDSGERQFSQRGDHHSHQQFEREQDSSRRRNIWQELKERYGA